MKHIHDGKKISIIVIENNESGSYIENWLSCFGIRYTETSRNKNIHLRPDVILAYNPEQLFNDFGFGC